MPFTVSHVAAVLPFVRSPLPPAALAFGAMAPDLFYFLRIGIPRDLSHSLLGAVTVDLAVALLAFALWRAVIKRPTLDYSPGWLRSRTQPSQGWRADLLGDRPPIVALAWAAAAVVLGTLTHLAWDTFTHDGTLDDVFPVLAGSIAGIEIDEWIHSASSLVGAIILAIWIRRWTRRTPVQPRTGLVTDRERRTVWIALIAIGLASAGATMLAKVAVGYGPFDVHVWFAMVIYGATVPALVAVTLAAAWHVRARSAVSS